MIVCNRRRILLNATAANADRGLCTSMPKCKSDRVAVRATVAAVTSISVSLRSKPAFCQATAVPMDYASVQNQQE